MAVMVEQRMSALVVRSESGIAGVVTDMDLLTSIDRNSDLDLFRQILAA